MRVKHIEREDENISFFNAGGTAGSYSNLAPEKLMLFWGFLFVKKEEIAFLFSSGSRKMIAKEKNAVFAFLFSSGSRKRDYKGEECRTCILRQLCGAEMMSPRTEKNPSG